MHLRGMAGMALTGTGSPGPMPGFFNTSKLLITSYDIKGTMHHVYQIRITTE